MKERGGVLRILAVTTIVVGIFVIALGD